MPKVIADDDDKVVALDSWPADPTSGISVTVANAGTDLSLQLVYPFDLDATDSDKLAQRAIGEPSNTEVLTKRNATGNYDVFRDFVDGQPNPTGDEAYELAKERGTILYLLRREGGKASAEDFAEGDEVSLWEVEVDTLQTPKEEGYRRARAPLAVKRHYKGLAIIAGA